MSLRKCLNCDRELFGRSDKKFCTEYCKSNFNYEKNKTKTNTLFKSIDLQLKRNRRLLKDYNTAGKSIVRSETIIHAGFNPSYFTHYWKNTHGDVYLFCYEYGFLKKIEHGIIKFILVKWQDYMH